MDIKNARSKVLASHRRLFQMEVIANVCFCFELAKEKAETFLGFPLFIESLSHVLGTSL